MRASADTRATRDRASGAPSALRALRDLFVAPPATEAGAVQAQAVDARTRAAPAVAILCAGEDSRAVAVAAAALLARRCGAPCTLASVWTRAPAPTRTEARPLAGGAARRMAATLNARGLSAAACGRTALVTLAADAAEAAGAARRAFAVAGDAPTVLVVGGPRDEAFDALLTDQDLVVVLSRTGATDAVAALAVEGLAALGPRAVARSFSLTPAARALALSGAGVPACVRRALDEPVAELR